MDDQEYLSAHFAHLQQAAFESAIASGSLDVMEPEQQVPLGRMYRQYAKADAIQQEEYALAARLGSSDLATSPIPRLRPAD